MSSQFWSRRRIYLNWSRRHTTGRRTRKGGMHASGILLIRLSGQARRIGRLGAHGQSTVVRQPLSLVHASEGYPRVHVVHRALCNRWCRELPAAVRQAAIAESFSLHLMPSGRAVHVRLDVLRIVECVCEHAVDLRRSEPRTLTRHTTLCARYRRRTGMCRVWRVEREKGRQRVRQRCGGAEVRRHTCAQWKKLHCPTVVSYATPLKTIRMRIRRRKGSKLRRRK